MAKSLKNLMGSGLGAQTAKLINGTVADPLTATGTIQADALPLTADVNVIATVPFGTGVLLPPSPQPGDELMIASLGANDLLVYPSLGGAVQGGGVNVPFTLPAGASLTLFARPGSRNWVALATAGSAGVPIGGLAAPTLGYPSPLASNPTTIAVSIPADWQAGPAGAPIDAIKLAYSPNADMSGATILSHALDEAVDTPGSTIHIGLPNFGAPTFLQAYGSHLGVDSANRSNITEWGDAAAPTVSTNASQSHSELIQYSIALTADKPSTWTFASGADDMLYEIVQIAGVWYVRPFGNGTFSYDVPTDVDMNHTNVIKVIATSLGGVASAPFTITDTITAADKTPDAFSFTDVNPATPSTVYTSNTITVSGLTNGISVPASVTTAQYSKNGGAWTAAGSFTMQNGDTLALKATAISGAVNSVVTIGTGTDTWTLDDGSIHEWRLYMTTAFAAPDRGRIAELEFHTTIGGANILTGGGVTLIAGSNEFGAFPVANMEDGNLATVVSVAPLPDYVGGIFTASVPTIAEIVIKSGSVAGDASWAPTGFYLAKMVGGSPVTVQTWTTGAWGTSVSRTFTV